MQMVQNTKIRRFLPFNSRILLDSTLCSQFGSDSPGLTDPIHWFTMRLMADSSSVVLLAWLFTYVLAWFSLGPAERCVEKQRSS